MCKSNLQSHTFRVMYYSMCMARADGTEDYIAEMPKYTNKLTNTHGEANQSVLACRHQGLSAIAVTFATCRIRNQERTR